MAKVLLINSNRFKHPWPVIPFGLCCIATVLETNGNHNVHFLDLCFSLNCAEDIRKTVRNFMPDVIGITVRNIDDTGGFNVHFLLDDVKKDVIDYCKKEFSGPIVIGGPSVGINGREMLDFFDLEYAVRGDGEAVMLEFANRIANQQPLEGLKGLIIRQEKVIVQDMEPFRVQDLDSLPFPKPQRYLNLGHYRRFGSPIQIQTKRGCTLKCSYCTYNKIEGKQYRLIDPKRVANEIEILVKETGINHVEFADSIFNVPLFHAKEVLREVIRKNLDLRLHTMGLSPAAVDEELLDLMKRAGFNEVDIGAESMCDVVLESLAKNFKRADVLNTANLLKKKKIPVTWFIMLGAPSETRETVLETLNTIGSVASKWDLVFISTGVRVYNESSLAQEILKRNIHGTMDNFLHPVKIEPNEIALEDIRAITKRYSFRFPNFYFYEKERIIPGWLLITGNFVLKMFRSRQPVWRLLILLKRIEWIFGIGLIKRRKYELNMNSYKRESQKNNGFSLIRHPKITSDN
ncbi:MAG: radical SAM protein [Bacteroidota bacterium]|nr:radical SAM protein [Bacteroidota bacterium]